MPSPGSSTIQAEIETVTFKIKGANGEVISQEIATGSNLSTGMGIGMDKGWTCAHPTTPSTFTTEIPAAFWFSNSNGSCWLKAIGLGLDDEVDKWIASYVSASDTHTYFPEIGSIMSFIQSNYSCGPGWSNAMDAVAYQCAETFVSYFVQDKG